VSLLSASPPTIEFRETDPFVRSKGCRWCRSRQGISSQVHPLPLRRSPTLSPRYGYSFDRRDARTCIQRRTPIRTSYRFGTSRGRSSRTPLFREAPFL
jgi:hypothetical protein